MIKVVLAGPYPKPDGMTGTFGRILNNIKSSYILRSEIQFIPYMLTLPSDGSLPKRFVVDSAKFIWIMRQKPDILHLITQKYHSTFREYPIIKIAKWLGIKTIVDVRAGALQSMLSRKNYRLQNCLMRKILSCADIIVLECKKDMPFIKKNFGCDGLFIPNTIMQEDFIRTKPARLKLDKGQPLKLIYSGRYTEAKGISVILNSLNILAARGIKVELHLTGQGTESNLLKLIRSYTEEPPKGTSVIDHGWDVPDLYALLASAHVFVMPTHHIGEGHSNSVSEAMMAGLGMILTDWFHREDVVPNRGAIIIPPHDPESLANAVNKYLTDSTCLIEAGQTNRKFVQDNYLDTICYPRLLELYKQLANE